MSNCVICNESLQGRERLFCSNRCKQQDKYERRLGKRCSVCHKPINKPTPVLGGYSQLCERKRCINQRGEQHGTSGNIT